MPIIGRKVPINLLSATPSKLTPDNLKGQLNSIGLFCDHTNPKPLAKYIKSVKDQLPNGSIESYWIGGPTPSSDESLYYMSEFDENDTVYTGLTETATGNWKPDGTALGYSPQLEFIQFPSHFDYLKKNRSSFTGVKEGPNNYHKFLPTVEAIMALFTEIGTNASSALIKGLDKDSIEAVLTNAIAPLKNENLTNYNNSDSRTIFLVENYDPSTNTADGIGVLSISWTLSIKDYKKKKHLLQHNTHLTVTARGVLYDSVSALQADYLFAKSHFKNNAFSLYKIPGRNKVHIFDKLPPANETTFLQALATNNQTQDQIQAIVLYAPNLQNIGVLDNDASGAESTYSKSVTTGFSFSSSQSVSTQLYAEASVELIKVGFSITFNITFTESYNKSTTETISFTVPPGKKAFTYQGVLNSAILVYDAKTDSYSYGEKARFMSNILVTKEKPLEE